MNCKIAKLFVSAALLITEATPIRASAYVVDRYSDNKKNQIYWYLSKCCFPSILSKFTQQEFQNRYPNLNLIETFGTKEAECKFIQNEIKKIDPDTKVIAITKSLYQFIVYDYLASDIDQKFKLNKSQGVFKLVASIKGKFNLRNYMNSDTTEEWKLTKSCGKFMEGEEIQDIFWKINNHALDMWKKYKGSVHDMANSLLSAFAACDTVKGEKSYKSYIRVLDYVNDGTDWSESKIGEKQITRLRTLSGTTDAGLAPEGWSPEHKSKLIGFTVNCIHFESENPNYILYRGGCEKPKFEYAKHTTISFSDGLGSGFIFDLGASAYALSAGINKLWILELDRTKLLKDQYPIFIPPAFHLLSAAGHGELFHVRTKVVQCITHNDGTADEGKLGLSFVIEPLIAGFKPNEIPEYFTTSNPEIWTEKWQEIESRSVLAKTGQGVFDTEGSDELQKMIKSIKKVSATGIF